MVRLVFRHYTQIWRSICTSESLRASTRVSTGFTLFRHSSPSFGSHHICFTSVTSVKNVNAGWYCHLAISYQSVSLRIWVWHPNTRIYGGLLGPCFKTGHLESLSQQPKWIKSILGEFYSWYLAPPEAEILDNKNKSTQHLRQIAFTAFLNPNQSIF